MASPQDPIGQLSPLKRALLALDDMKSKLDTLERSRSEPIAIIGIGCRFPGGARDPESFWRMLREGVDAVREVPKSRWDIDAYFDPDPNKSGKTYARWGAFLEDVDRFDPQLFGIAPREAAAIDPQQRLLLEVTWEALEDAAVPPDRLSNSATGVFVGICSMDYAALQIQRGDLSRIDAYSASGSAHSIAPGRLSYVLGLKGPSMAVDTACSSSLVAVHLACQSLRDGECRMALAGGVHLLLSPLNTLCFSRLRMLSSDGRCKTFDAAGDGFVEGEGCGVVVLKRLSDALADGDRIVAVIRGSAVNQDGPSSSLTAPNGPSQEAVIRASLERARIRPADVGYVEAHGTGTSLGDPIEVQALGAVLGEGRPKERPLAIGSLKTNIGHTEAAAGIAGLIKLALAVRHGEIPPHLHFRDPNPYIRWAELPVRVVTERTAWPRENGSRVGGVSSFGFSGTNVHITVAEAPAPETVEQREDRPVHVLTLSARTETSLRDLAGRWAERIASCDAPLADVAFTANTGRAHLSHRIALTAASLDEARAGLKGVAAGTTASKPVRTFAGSDRARVAFLCTGQGAQFAGMGRELYETQPTFRSALDRCADLLQPHLDRPLLSLIHSETPGDAAIHRTEYAQPALFAFEFALAELWRSWGVMPSAVLGHSVGEYVAACLAGVFSLEDALHLVASRGRLMGSLPPGGAMAAVFAAEERVRTALEGYEQHASIAAINGPESVVVSGTEAAVAAVLARLGAEGVLFERLTVSHAFHSPLMDPILDEFERVAGAIKSAPPRITLISNLTGQPVRGAEIGTAGYWRRHVRQPVQFARGIGALCELGYDVFLEIGPRPTLSAMGRRVGVDGASWLAPMRAGGGDWRRIADAVGELYVRGVEIDWTGFDRDYRRRKLPMPTYAFERQRYWIAEEDPASRPRRASNEARDGGSRLHPLLGRRLSSALKDCQFESELGAEVVPFLGDHRKHGQAILPATAYLEMGLAAAREALGPGPHSVDDLVISDPLTFTDEPTRVQAIVTPDGNGSASFQLFSCEPRDVADGDASRASGERWRLHAEATLGRAAASQQGAGEPLPTIRARCAEAVAVDEFYRRLEEGGHEYGPAFRGIVDLWKGEREALARVELPGADAGAYQLHPALLDAAMQLIDASVPASAKHAADGRVYLPVSLGGFTVHRSGAARGWSHVRLQASVDSAADGFRVDVTMYDDDGGTIAEVKDIYLRRTAPVAADRRAEDPLAAWLHELVWRHGERASAARSQPPAGVWLVLADPGGLGVDLARRLEAEGARAVVVMPGEGYDASGERVLLNPDNPEHFGRLVQHVLTEGEERLAGVIDLWPLQAADAEPAAAELQDGVRIACGSLLHLVQALSAEGVPSRPRLWIVTRGGVAAGAESPRSSVSQAPVWGLARTIAAEHPDLRCACIDLDPESPGGDLDGIWSEILTPDGEDQVALRQHRRYVARLVRSARPELSPAAPGATAEAVTLEIGARGVLDNLELRPAGRRAPAEGEVEIRVSAAGLNFRDVLNALGMYEGTPGPLGAECVGTVVRAGAGVTHVNVGDEVFGLAVASLGTYVTTPAHAIARRPDCLTTEEAATIPVTFLTAEYALNHLARMRRGDRVLIHAAAGGVGVAAVQLARRAGAEIFATAGSDEKRAYLHSLGVRHVLSSRSIGFAEELMALTGGEGVDIVLNSLAGEFIDKSLSTLRPGGRFLEIGRAGIWSKERMASARPDVAYYPIYLGEVDPQLVHQMLLDLIGALAAGSLEPLPRRVFPLTDAVNAFRFMAQAKHIGKIVFTVGAESSPLGTRVRPDATYLITGGLGSLGLQVARWMVEAGARHLVLAGRTPPSNPARQLVDELERSGAGVVLAQTDVSREADVAALLADIAARLPALGGIVHAAGVLDDGVLAQQTWPRFEQVLAPKIAGAWHLHQQTRALDLDFFVMFSSMVTVLGSSGQGSYAAANAFLDALAHHRRALGRPGLSIAWGPWADGGMAAGVSERDHRRWRERGIGFISPGAGVEALGRLISARVPAQVAVLPIDWSVLLRDLGSGEEPPLLSELAGSITRNQPATSARSRGSLAREIASAAPNRRRSVVQAKLTESANKVLGLDPENPIDVQQPLRDLGLDSLMAVELRNAIAEALDRTLPATLLFKHPTLDALCGFVMAQLPGATSDHPEGEPAPEPAESDVVLATLSDDEARKLLVDELSSLSASAWAVDEA